MRFIAGGYFARRLDREGMEFGLGREGTIVASNPLRTGNEGAVPIVFSKPKLGPPRPRARKRGPKPTHQRECCCLNCRRTLPAVKWPRHYVGLVGQHAGSFEDLEKFRRAARRFWMSFECHLERQYVDPDLEEELSKLRNEPVRIGSVICAPRAH
jgi:hypothetical protein